MKKIHTTEFCVTVMHRLLDLCPLYQGKKGKVEVRRQCWELWEALESWVKADTFRSAHLLCSYCLGAGAALHVWR